jgi:electron transfer flavoprotein alpha subunit
MAGALPGASLIAGLVGPDVRAAANGVAGCGASRFLGVSGPDFAQARYASDAAAAEALGKAGAATVVIAAGTSRWSRVLSGVAQRLGGRVDTHVTGISGTAEGLAVSRWYYRQRMEATLTRKGRPWIIALDPGCHAPWQGDAGTATVEAVAVSLSVECKRTTVTGVQAPPSDQQTIRPDADLLFVAGAGWTKSQSDGKAHASEAAELILGFLKKSQASLGGSKSVVDLKGEGQAVLPFMTHLNQIGQTGATPRHPKGLSTCCHGEEPHVVGWRFINERRAVNLDPNCGWARGKADVLYVADAFEVMRKVNGLLGEG